MRDPILEEANIDGWLTHFQQQGRYDNIRDWRQRIEDKEARSGHRPPRLIKIDEAVKDFRQALLIEEQYSESATALLRTLNRPKPPIVELWRLQNEDNRPTVLTAEQQAYVEFYEKAEKERRKWCVDISTDRWDRWGVLEGVILDCRNRAENAEAQGHIEDARHFTEHAERAWSELHADLAKVGEQWRAENPELVRVIVDQVTGKSWVKPVPTMAFKEYRAKQLADLKIALFSPDWAPSPVLPQETFYKGRLYFIAANLILKHFGMEEEVAQSFMSDLQIKAFQAWEHWNQLVGSAIGADQSVGLDHDAKLRACKVAAGRVYWDLLEEIKREGIGCITMLENHLSEALNTLLNDPDQVKRDMLDRKLYKSSVHCLKSTDPKLEEEERDATEQNYARRETLLQIVITQLTPRQKAILILMQQDHSHKSIAEKLALDSKTIQREFKKIKSLAQTLRDRRQL